MRKHIFIWLLILAWPMSSWSAGEEITLTQTQMKHNFCDLLSSIQLEFESTYAPREWKQSQHNWNVAGAIEEAKAKIWAENSLDRQRYQEIIRDFFASSKDYHVGASFLNWDLSMLPLEVVSAEGRTFIANIYREFISEAAFPFEVGDEIIEFNGRPVSEVLAEIAEQINGSNDGANLGLADTYLTVRPSARGIPSPKGAVSLRVRSQERGKTHTLQLCWEHNACPCCKDPRVMQASLEAEQSNTMRRLSRKDPEYLRKLMQDFFSPKMEIPDNEVYKRLAKALGESRSENHFSLGSTKSILPALGATWWNSSDLQQSPFYQAYIYEHPYTDQKIGFLRIPHYSGGDASLLKDIIEKLEEETEALVIDQMYNPGGSVMRLYAIASMLTDDALITPKHQLALCDLVAAQAAHLQSVLKDCIRDDVDARHLLGEDWFGYPISYSMVQLWIQYLDFIIEEWGAGKVLTDPVHLALVDQINPHPQVRYTKPILLLTNNLDFSGGDFFPAIMQDNQRVTILGARTAGAGGCVTANQAGTQSNTGLFSFHYTTTLAWRPNGQAIEDLGVSPDIFYQLSIDDIQNGCEGFTEAIHNEIEKLVHKSDAS